MARRKTVEDSTVTGPAMLSDMMDALSGGELQDVSEEVKSAFQDQQVKRS